MYNKENYRRWYDKHKDDPEFKEKQKRSANTYKEKYIKKYGIESWRKRGCATQKEYRNSPKFNIENHRNIVRKWRENLAFEVLTHYSGNPLRCACPNCYYHIHDCPIEFLTIDHINNDGAKQRENLYNGKRRYGAGKRFYSWLKQNGYPEGYQVLCYNCNCGKERNKGVCPHLG